jgi:hypothetical protein
MGTGVSASVIVAYGGFFVRSFCLRNRLLINVRSRDTVFVAYLVRTMYFC